MTKHFTLAALIAALPAGAFALTLGQELGTTEGDIRAALEAQGYVVQEIEIEADEIEAEVLLDDVAMEVEVDATTGLVVALELDEDDDDDADDEGDEDDDENEG